MFYCSEPVHLNDDDDDEEETLGEYVQSTKTAEEDRKQIELPRTGRIPWNLITKMSFPLILMDVSMTHSHMTNGHSSISSNSGT